LEIFQFDVAAGHIKAASCVVSAWQTRV
jgi:hypothetical protein